MPARVVLVANQKGGVGKTTIASSIATGFTLQGKRVLMLDTDPQQSLSQWRNYGAGKDHEKDLPWVERWDNSVSLGEKVKKERHNYDYIFLDSASNLGFKGDEAQKIMIAALRASDDVLIPMGPSPYDVNGSADFINLIKELWVRVEAQLPRAHVVINSVRPGTTLGQEVSDYVAQMYGLPILKTSIQQREAYRQCVIDGASVFHYGDKGAIKNANDLMAELAAIFEGTDGGAA